jgi:hypothetical protein
MRDQWPNKIAAANAGGVPWVHREAAGCFVLQSPAWLNLVVRRLRTVAKSLATFGLTTSNRVNAELRTKTRITTQAATQVRHPAPTDSSQNSPPRAAATIDVSIPEHYRRAIAHAARDTFPGSRPPT